MDCEAATKDPGDASIPSCESCRRRKLKCGRQQPTCTNCDNFQVDCVYNLDKKKPGLKVGAVESLSRRLEIVEAALSQQDPSQHNRGDLPRNGSIVENLAQHALDSTHVVLSSLTRELQGLTNAVIGAQTHTMHSRPLDDAFMSSTPPHKRRRVLSDDCALTLTEPLNEIDTIFSRSTTYYRQNIHVLDAYFCRIQPWLSIVHEPSFRKQFHNQKLSNSMRLVVKAMLVATFPFAEQAKVLDVEAHKRMREVCKSAISMALDTTCIEHVQALLILTYAVIVDGDIRRASSLLGLITRQLEILGVHREHPSESQGQSMDASVQIIATTDWISEEEERRLVWNVKILDRLCSALTGDTGNVSVSTFSRRLPACASFWYSNRQRTTPFHEHSNLIDHNNGDAIQNSQAKASSSPTLHMDRCTWKGSLAFFIETVESMGAILHHLDQTVVYNDRHDVSSW